MPHEYAQCYAVVCSVVVVLSVLIQFRWSIHLCSTGRSIVHGKIIWRTVLHWGRVTSYMRQETNHNCFRWWLVAWSTPSHHLNECHDIVNWTPGKNFSEILIKVYIFPFNKMHFNLSLGNLRPFCHGLNMLISTTWLNCSKTHQGANSVHNSLESTVYDWYHSPRFAQSVFNEESTALLIQRFTHFAVILLQNCIWICFSIPIIHYHATTVGWRT